MSEPIFERDEWVLPADAWPETPHADRLKAALLDQTSRVVRRRARLRQLRRLTTLGLAYAAGIVTAAIAWRAGPAQVAQLDQRPAPLTARREEGSRPHRPDETHGASAAPNERLDEQRLDEQRLATMSPGELRRLVPDASPEQQIRLLEMAGDRYLYGRADVVSALDCYRQVLELTPPDARRQPLPNESWLLAELRASPGE